jgi:hypothetical protein
MPRNRAFGERAALPHGILTQRKMIPAGPVLVACVAKYF